MYTFLFVLRFVITAIFPRFYQINPVDSYVWSIWLRYDSHDIKKKLRTLYIGGGTQTALYLLTQLAFYWKGWRISDLSYLETD